MTEFSHAEKLKEARRELAMRKTVYLRWVSQGREGWTQDRADRGIALMASIVADYERCAPQGVLSL